MVAFMHTGTRLTAGYRYTTLGDATKSWRRQALWGLLFVVYGMLGALLVPSGLSRFFTVCVWVSLMSKVWLTLRQPVRI